MASYPGCGSHPFPTCFACGTDRAEGDGLRIFPGPVADQDGATRVAATWTPHPSVAEDFHAYVDDHRAPRWPLTWAALDCIGGWAGDLDRTADGARPDDRPGRRAAGRSARSTSSSASPRRARAARPAPPPRCTTPTAGSSAAPSTSGSPSTPPPSADAVRRFDSVHAAVAARPCRRSVPWRFERSKRAWWRRRGLLPGLRPQLRRRRRRRHRRPAGHHRAAAVPARPRRRRALDHAVLPLARSTTTATTSPTTATSTRCSAASPTPTRCSTTRPRARPQGRSSTSCPTTPPTSTSGSRRRWPPARAAPSGSATCSATGKGAAGEQPPEQLALGVRRHRLDAASTDGEWYLHLFDAHPARPQLAQPRGRATMFEDVLRFWLDRGVDGFRVDVAHGLFKDGEPARPGRRRRRPARPPARQLACSSATPRTSRCGTSPRCTTSTGAGAGSSTSTTATGWPSPRPGPRRRVDGARTSAPTSSSRRSTSTGCWRTGRPPHSPTVITRHLRRASSRSAPRPTWVLEQPRRHPARHPVRRRRAVGVARARAATLTMLALPGSAYLYQGEELGLEQVDVGPEHRQDPAWFRTGGVRSRRLPGVRPGVAGRPTASARAASQPAGCRNRPTGPDSPSRPRRRMRGRR